MTSTMKVTDQAFNFQKANVVHGSYQFNRQYPQESLGDYTVSSSQGPMTTFQLIPNVFNLSKSYLAFTFYLPASGAGTYSWLDVNGLKMISRITVQPQSGPVVMDLNVVDRYLDVVMRKAFSFADVNTWDKVVSVNTETTTGGSGSFFEGLTIGSGIALPLRSDANASTGARTDEAAYLITATAATNAIYLDVKITLDKFVDSILSVDKDIFWGNNNLTITIYWNPLIYVWTSTAAANPTAGALAWVAGDGVSTPTIQNPTMYVAIQQNQQLAKDIRDACGSDSGISFKTSYPYEWMQTIGAGGNNLVTYYNTGQGSHIKKIYWAVYQTGATLYSNYVKSNVANRVNTILTQVNGINVQQYPMNPAVGDDYMYNRESLRGSAIQTFNEYLYNWSWCEDFTANDCQFLQKLFPDVPKDNLIDGYPLFLGQMQYNITSTTTVNSSNYLYTIFLREIKISKAGITIV